MSDDTANAFPMPPPRSFALNDKATPALAAGLYEIRADHQLKDFQAASAPSLASGGTLRFQVDAPRFTLDQAELHAVHPPANSVGDFSHILPHVVLDRRTLPWARSLSGAAAGGPWLALLVFDEDELAVGDPGSPGRCTATTVGALLDDQTAQGPAISGLTNAERAESCLGIRFSADLFSAIIPGPGELPLLAHVRQVNLEEQRARDEPPDLDDDGWFSLIVANRFPVPSDETRARHRRTIVHLVSLEGFEAWLDGTPVPKPQVGMASLACWSFTCLTARSETFQGLARGLVADGRIGPDDLRLRLPPPGGDRPTPAEREVDARLRDGYVPLSWLTATGEETFAWYRGPLTPHNIARQPKEEPFPSAAAAMVYDPAFGTFDHSLAAAWQIGRMVALADGPYVKALISLRRRLFRRLDGLVSRGEGSSGEGMAPEAAARPSRALARGLADGPLLTRALAEGPLAAPLPEAEQALPWHAIQPRSLPPSAHVLRTAAALPEVQATLTAEEAAQMAPVLASLRDMMLLKTIPFAYLVPESDKADGEAALLPRESLRFFHLDVNWLDAMLDGALSVGAQCDRDRSLDDIVRKAVWADFNALQADLRAPAKTGLLLRSALVSGWPGLAVRAGRGKLTIPTLRFERLTSTLLFCLFDGAPNEVVLSEPAQSLQFGLDDDGRVPPRYLAGQPFGLLVPDKSPVEVPRRPQDDRVINLGEAEVGLAVRLTRSTGRAIGGAALAVQLFRHPGRLTLRLPA